MENKPIKQKSIIEFLSADREPLPLWLKSYEVGQMVDPKNLFTSRVVYNPGAGIEGGPIKVFNASHSAHVFVYVDYGFNKEEIDSALSDDAFLGYHIIYEDRLSAEQLISKAPVYHLTDEEMNIVKGNYEIVSIPTDNSFGILKIYQRDDEYGEEHGSFRFALLYLGGDAIACYDVLFGNTDCTPFCCVVDAYSFCDAYDHFSKGSLIERIAKRTGKLPKYLLCANHCTGWTGYKMNKRVGGSRNRFIWEKEKMTDFIIEDGVLTKYYGNEKEILIPKSVTEIGESAFYSCHSIEKIRLEGDISIIGDAAFSDCINLSDFKIPGNISYLGAYAFYDCASLSFIEIPEGIKAIERETFSGCQKLSDVIIPKSIKSIETMSFAFCPALSGVFYSGKEEDWNNIEFEVFNEDLINTPRYYYSKEKPEKNGNFWHYKNGLPAVW